MKQKSFSVVIGFLLLWVVLTASALAGQVVTDDVKSWAKEALEQERALKTTTPPPNSVAILYFLNKTEWSNLDLLQKGLTIMLMTDLSKVKEIQVVERVKLQALVDELDLGVSGLVEPDTASRVGKLLGAEHLVGGDILKSKIDQFKLRSNLLDVPTEEIVGRPMAEGELLAELFRMEKDLLFQIIQELKIELTPELEAELGKRVTTNLQALLYLFQGIEQSDLGNYEKAAEFYQKALQEDPGVEEAKDSLQELLALNLWQGGPEAYAALEAEAFGLADNVPPDDRGILGIDERRPGEPLEVEIVEPEPEVNFIFYGKTYDLETSFEYGRPDLDLENPFGVGSDYPRMVAPLYGYFGDLVPEPVVKTDLFYRYTWTDESNPGASYSATLYMNDESQDSDWIVMSYGDLNEPDVEYDVLVGVSPGDGSEEDHPAPGQPRGVAERDLSEETGETIPDEGGKYLTIYEEFYSGENPFDLSNSFLIFRPDGDNKYTVTAGTRDMIVDMIGSGDNADMTSLDQAIVNVTDAELLDRVDNGEFMPGQFGGDGVGTYNDDGWAQWSGYQYGLQTVGQDEYGNPMLFTNSNTLQRLNSSRFLSYAVQVEEDRVNEQIIEMANHADTIKARVAAYKAQGYGDIRARDAALTEMADAQSGRVTKDRNGNWVRAQQYVLRPDASTVQLLNVCLRGADAGDLSGLSTMEFSTKFKESLDANRDLRTLPWNDWLNTYSDGDAGKYVYSPAFTYDEQQYNPQLDSMDVKFTNTGNESLSESRGFGNREYINDSEGQYITSERLSLVSLTRGSQTYGQTYGDDGKVPLPSGGYDVINDNVGRFDYVFPSGQSSPQSIRVEFYEADDSGELDVYSSNQGFKDIWEALSVNETGLRFNETAAPNIGNNNLEIAIDAGRNFFTKPIDVVYIPMSRMLWRDSTPQAPTDVRVLSGS